MISMAKNAANLSKAQLIVSTSQEKCHTISYEIIQKKNKNVQYDIYGLIFKLNSRRF
jgi:hypothetical protein